MVPPLSSSVRRVSKCRPRYSQAGKTHDGRLAVHAGVSACVHVCARVVLRPSTIRSCVRSATRIAKGRSTRWRKKRKKERKKTCTIEAKRITSWSYSSSSGRDHFEIGFCHTTTTITEILLFAVL